MYTVSIIRYQQEDEVFRHPTLEDAQARFRSLTWAFNGGELKKGAILGVFVNEGIRTHEAWYNPNTIIDFLVRGLV